MQAAQLAGVNRATVYRWVQNHPEFRAAYNTWQRELAESARSRLLKLSERAVDVIERALQENDREVAVKVLRDMGVMRGRKQGSTDAQVLKLNLDLKAKRERRQAERLMPDFLLGMAGVSAERRQRILDRREKLNIPWDPEAVAVKTAGDVRSAAHATNDASSENATSGAGAPRASAGATGEQGAPVAAKSSPLQEIRLAQELMDQMLADATTRATAAAAPHDLAADPAA